MINLKYPVASTILGIYLLICGCSNIQPTNAEAERSFEIHPLLKLSKSLSISEIGYAEAVATGGGINGTITCTLLVNHADSSLYGTLKVPKGITSCELMICIYDTLGKKIGQGYDTLTQSHFSTGKCATTSIGVESAKPHIDTMFTVKDSIRLLDSITIQAAASDSFGGSIQKLEWNIANSTWVIGDSDTTFQVLQSHLPLVCSLRVTDDEGNVNTRSIAATILLPSYMSDMRLIRAKDSSFEMGSIRETSEQPIHSVSFTYDFWIDTIEISQGYFNSLMSKYHANFALPARPFSEGDNISVFMISWYDAVLFCNARSRDDEMDTIYSYTSITGNPGNSCSITGLSIDMSKNGYRLPTEAEWEYACRAGTTTKYYWGDDLNHAYAWLDGSGDIRPGALKLPNAWGLYDMIGNISEWCNDYYGSYSSGNAVDPSGPTSGTNRVARGGFKNMAKFASSTYREKNDPSTHGSGVVGFRTILKAH